MSKAKPSRNNPKVAQSNPTVKYVPKQSSGNSKWIYLSLALTFLIYLPYMHNGLTNADDQQAIVENELIHQINLSAIVQMFQSYQLGMYAPVTQVLLS
ncbi:MAG: hypothetical protein ABIV51_05460, partial [Saprospiraceae bacterium]